MGKMRLITTTPAERVERSPADLDRLSLAQALRDFEIANARVLDLTQRLIESERARRDAEVEVQQLRAQRSEGPIPMRPLRDVLTDWALGRAGHLARNVGSWLRS